MRALDLPRVTEQDLPSAAQAAQLYTSSLGGTLTDPHPFAPSPFRSRLQHALCDRAFVAAVPDLTCLLDSAVNRNYVPFQDALLILIEKTEQYVNILP